MTKGQDKGTVHFHILGVLLAITVLYLLSLTIVKPRAYYTRGEGRQSGGVEYYSVKTSGNKPYQPGVENMPVDAMGDMLESAVDIQITALRVKAEAARIVWDSLDGKTQEEVLAGFVKDVQSQQDQVNRLLDLYQSSKWVLLKRNGSIERVEELLEYIGRRQKELTAFLERIQGAKSGGSIAK